MTAYGGSRLKALTLVVLAAIALAACSTPSAQPATHPSAHPSAAAATAQSTPGLAASPAPDPSLAPIATLTAIRPRNTPTGIPAATNGQLDPSLLISVAPDCLAYRPAATSLSRLFWLAQASGVSLGASICYRPVVQQAADRNSACTSGNCACAAKGGTSMHGWGQAADLRDANGSVDTFTSPTYAWLVQVAARFGWNHPGWAVPGGSPCPEPWHWEWVGDGGTLHAAPIKADAVALVPTSGGDGYRLVTGLGAVTARGAATAATAAADPTLDRLVVAGVPVPGGSGYWLTTAGGSVLAAGGAPTLGSIVPALAPTTTAITAMAATPTGRGYWLLAGNGQLFAFGDAPALGGHLPSGRDFVGLAATSSGKGLWLVGSDGQVLALGDAPTLGSPAGVNVARDPVVAMTATPTAKGYWLASAAGKVVAFGDAAAAGSAPSGLTEPVVSISASPTGHGYWLLTAAGSVYALGDAGYFGNA